MARFVEIKRVLQELSNRSFYGRRYLPATTYRATCACNRTACLKTVPFGLNSQSKRSLLRGFVESVFETTRHLRYVFRKNRSAKTRLRSRNFFVAHDILLTSSNMT